VEQSIKEVESTFTSKLNKLKLESKVTYKDNTKVQYRELSLILEEIQLMLENMTLFNEPIQKTLDDILNDYKKMMVKDPNAPIRLRQALRDLPGS